MSHLDYLLLDRTQCFRICECLYYARHLLKSEMKTPFGVFPTAVRRADCTATSHLFVPEISFSGNSAFHWPRANILTLGTRSTLTGARNLKHSRCHPPTKSCTPHGQRPSPTLRCIAGFVLCCSRMATSASFSSPLSITLCNHVMKTSIRWNCWRSSLAPRP